MIERVIIYTCNLGIVLLREHLGLLLVFLTALLASRYYLKVLKRHLPPGPWGYPFLGYLPYLDGKMHVTLANLAREFGSIYRLQFGTKLCVVLSDPAVIREAFRLEEFSYRPVSPLYDAVGQYGVINTVGKFWQDQRRFIHERMRHLGMTMSTIGRQQMELRINNEVESLLQTIASRKSQPMEIDTHLASASHNVISMVLMSVRYSHDHPTFTKFRKLHEDGFRIFCSSASVNYFHILKYLPSFTKTLDRLKCNQKQTHGMIMEIIRERREEFDPNVTRDLLDGYLLKEHQIKEDLIERFGTADSFDKAEFEKQLIHVIGDVLSAGEETVKNSLMWGFIFLLHHPEVTLKIQEELDSVVGRQRLPGMNDMPHLPYVEATICEVLRRSTVIPLGTTHATSRDTKLNGFDIPKGTEVIPLLYACNMDPNNWEEPEKFNPSRFLDETGAVKKPDYFIPFGVGRRICLGQIMAKAEIFLILTSILHVFNIENPTDTELPSLEGHLGATLAPSGFKVCFIAREVEKIANLDMFPSECRTKGL